MRPGRGQATPKVSFRYLERLRRYLAETRNFLARCAPFWQFTPWPPLPPAPRFFIRIWPLTDTPSKKRIFRIGRAVSQIPHFGGRKILPYEYKDTSLINTPLSAYNIKPPKRDRKGGGGRGEWCEPASVFCVVTREVVPIPNCVSESFLYILEQNILSPLFIHPSPQPLPLTLSHNIQTVPLPQPVSRIDKYPIAMRTPVEPAICL